MRRLIIIYFWLVKSRNNTSLKELLQFLFKPKVKTLAKRFIKNIESHAAYYEITLTETTDKLYWPKEYSINGIYQVACETFDRTDWHYYQKRHTEVVEGEIILDVGVAEGLFILSVIDKCKKVFMVEPNDLFFNALQKTFKPYNDKVEMFNVAVGSEDGEVMFDESSLSGKIGENNSAGRLKKIYSIDHLVPEHVELTYLKADIEGYELEMLKGARKTILRSKPKIAITSYHTENNALEMITFVKSIVPDYNYYVKGIFHDQGKPVMIHFWIPSEVD